MSASSPKKIRSDQSPGRIVVTWVVTVFACAISLMVLVNFGFREFSLPGAVVGGLFSLFALGALYESIRMTLEYVKYGRVNLHVESEPPVAGQRFSAMLTLPAGTLGMGTVSAELACVNVAWRLDSKNKSYRVEDDRWARKQFFGLVRGAGEDRATLQFDLPADQPASDLPEQVDTPNSYYSQSIEVGKDYYRWELRVTAAVPGIDLQRTFRLRVAPGPDGAGARPEVAPPPRLSPEMTAKLKARLETRRRAKIRLALVCAAAGLASFVIPFVIMGLAVGLAGCPMSASTAKPPVCEFAGIDWGPLLAGVYGFMPYLVPAAIGVSVIVYIAGRIWLDRKDKANGPAALVAALGALAFVVYQFWLYQFSPQPVQSVAVEPPATKAAGTVPSWKEGDEVVRLRHALAAIQVERGADHPAAGLAQYQLSLVYERQKRHAEQERALLAALGILEKHPGDAVRREAGKGDGTVDKEVVARRLGDFYRDQGRYELALEHYERAYRYAREIRTSKADLNARLARNSAGRMAAACKLGRWDMADEAMRNLKEHIAHVGLQERKQLEYWVRTGEPRLAARNC